MSKNFLIALLILVLLGSGAFIWSQNEQINKGTMALEQYNSIKNSNGNSQDSQPNQAIQAIPTVDTGANNDCQQYITQGFGNRFVRSFSEQKARYTDNFSNITIENMSGFTRKSVDTSYFSVRVPEQTTGAMYLLRRNDSNEGLRFLEASHFLNQDLVTLMDFSLQPGVWNIEQVMQNPGVCIIQDDREGMYHTATIQQCGDAFCKLSMQGYTYITQPVSGDQTLVIRISHDADQLVDLLIQETLASLVIK